MIIMRMNPGAGMGNHMFMYAAGLAAAKRLGTQLKLATWSLSPGNKYRPYELSCFPAITEPEASFSDVWNISPYTALMKLVEYKRIRRYHVIRRILRSLLQKFPRSVKDKGIYYQAPNEDFSRIPDNKIMIGYWIGKNYVSDIAFANLVRRKFRFSPECFNPELTEKIQSCNSIALHVRRGDKVNNPAFLASDEHYLRASIEKISSLVRQPKFFVFSDDIQWCRKTLPQIYDADYTFIEGQRTGHDLALMTICRHVIMAPSTFSWWGAWLNENPGKIIVIPKYFTRGQKGKSNLCLDDWISI